MVNLAHELLHSYMLTTLANSGYVIFDVDGVPKLNVFCEGSINYNNVNLNSLAVEDRFPALICAMNQNGTLNDEWSHEIFNSTIFEIESYRQQLETLILNEYDWNNENSNFKDEAMNVFGSNWKQEIARAVSYIGLKHTDGYSNYINSYSTAYLKLIFINSIRSKITNANSQCQ